MRSRIFNLNWEEFDYKDPEQCKQLAGAMQFFCAMPNKFVPGRLSKVKEFVEGHKAVHTAQMQMFTLPSDFPTYEKAIEVAEKFHITTDYDNGYEQIFDVKNFEGTKASGFDVSDVESGLAFRMVLPGEKLKVYQMEGEKERCYFSYYGGALGWFRGLFDDQEWWTIEDNAIEFRNKAYSHRASIFYALIEAAATLKGCCAVVPANCTDCHADALSIANSLNYAAQTILENTKDKGYNLNPATTQFIVLAPLQMNGRIKQALGVRTQAFGDSTRVSNFGFVHITSLMLTSPTRVFVILPKKKLKAGYRMNLSLFDDFDILSYTDTVAGWMRYGGCIGDLDQIECIDFEALSGSCPPTP